MSIKFNGERVGTCITNYQPTDFSQVTTQPEFVLKGKKFYDETGQLREGTAVFNMSSDVIIKNCTVEGKTLICE